MKALRITLRLFCSIFPVRGRHRLADRFGKRLAPAGKETIRIGKIIFPIDHQVAMYRYVYYGLYEEHFVNLLKRIIRKGDIVIEPGANIGYITAVLSSLAGENGKVISLEPSRICYDIIKNYLDQPNITLLNKAIADIDGQLSFVDKPIVIEHGYSSLSAFTGRNSGDNEYLIDTVTIDNLMKNQNVKHVRLLKLDVEGAELMALQGSAHALAAKAIDYILVETAFVGALADTNKQIHALLHGAGYSCYLMTRTGLRSFDYFAEKDSRHDVIWTHLSQ